VDAGMTAAMNHRHTEVAVDGPVITIVSGDEAFGVDRASTGGASGLVGVSYAAVGMAGFCGLRNGKSGEGSGCNG
jgi:hypothetical protein